MTPRERYYRDLRYEDFSPDPAQERAVGYTQALYEKLVNGQAVRGKFLARLANLFQTSSRAVPITGLYFWGGVGRGKTYLVDAFYDCLPFAEKQRIHFHRFMHMVHRELKGIRDREHPLRLIADRIAATTRVLCFDEMHVTNIADAMLLGGLLQELFERGVVLVATSNEAPENLYRNGLQRERFLPAIDGIKEHTHVVQVDNGTDYRLRYLEHAEIYHCPLDQAADAMLHANFTHIAPNTSREQTAIEIEGRSIPTVSCADGVVWFEFRDICDGPRGAADYIEIARQYQTVLIANIPRLVDDENDTARRFMTLIDEFYDRNVKLIVTAGAPPEELYTGTRHAREYQRTISRLMEMRTHAYLAQPHLA